MLSPIKSLSCLLLFIQGFSVNARPPENSVILGITSQTRARLTSRLPVKILCIGDSMSDAGYNFPSISRALMIRMRDVYGDGGQGLDGWDLGSNPEAFGRPMPTGFFFSVSAALYPGDHLDCIQGGTNYYLDRSGWMAGNPYNSAGLFWYSHPGGGSFRVGITNVWTQAAEGPNTLLNGYSPTPEIHYTNWPTVPSSHLEIRVTGVTGTNYLIGPELANRTSGVEVFFFARGGVSLSQQLSLGINLLNQLGASVSPDLVIYHAKDYGPAPDSQDTNTISTNLTLLLSSFTNKTTGIIIVGTPPGDSLGGQNAELQNLVERQVAKANGFGFVDLYGAFASLEQNQANGLMNDSTHPSKFGASVWADETARQLGFNEAIAVPPPEIISVVHDAKTLTLTWNAKPGQTYQLQSTTDLANAWSDWNSATMATNTAASASDPIPEGTSYRYYRVRIAAPH
ncbi:MAG: hypothetical protein JWM99_5015 [Verrucomicrobiales bacterium]|nr:hypothetical protein [Verrucomicrobiales bacterium]